MKSRQNSRGEQSRVARGRRAVAVGAAPLLVRPVAAACAAAEKLMTRRTARPPRRQAGPRQWRPVPAVTSSSMQGEENLRSFIRSGCFFSRRF